MNQSQYQELFSFIWNIANDVLVNAFSKGQYKNVILPMLVLRRLDVLLEPTKAEVVTLKKSMEAEGLDEKAAAGLFYSTTGYPFYNTSNFTMRTLKSEVNPQRLKQNFIDYLNGYSQDVIDIIDKLRLRHVVDDLTETNRLGSIIEKFTSDSINLSSKDILDDEGNVTKPALDNHTMGIMFEELLRKFNEENNVTEAGEHFTPRDYVKLLADIAVLPVADQIDNQLYTIYDGACGTGGILTISEKRFQEIASQRNKDKARILIYGQELMPDTYATCKADLMISGDIKNFHYDYDGSDREYIAYGSTISQDGHRGERFDFCISNPPFGTPWKQDLKILGISEKKKEEDFTDPRFRAVMDNEELCFLPSIGDCQMLFLANNLSRMKEDSKFGSRIVEVHNGSSLFTGDAGQGASNLRRYIIENDLLEAIIAMPENDFYNTGIGTYIWVLTNRKEERRKGKVQLIDATEIKTPLRKNLGEKNSQTNEENREEIIRLLMAFEENEKSKIFPNREFGYWKLRVDRPLRLRVLKDYNLKDVFTKKKDIERVKSAMSSLPENLPLDDWNEWLRYFKKVELTKGIMRKLQSVMTVKDEDAKIVKGEIDSDLKDEEQIPLLYPGGIDGFMEKEVLPYTPDAIYSPNEAVIGYELSFTKYFYKPVDLRSLSDITTDIRTIEERLGGEMKLILN